MYDKFRQYLYYFIIAIISFISLVFLPMMGSEVGIGLKLPNTVAGWVVWIISKVIMAVVNVLIFHSFLSQAVLNVKDNECYKQAIDILRDTKEKKYVPRSKSQFLKHEWLTKGVTIFITTLLSVFALTQAILTFDYVTMLTYLFVIIMGVVFGILEMKKAENYYTSEFLDYAKELKNDNERRESIQEPRRTSTEESERH